MIILGLKVEGHLRLVQTIKKKLKLRMRSK